MRFDDQRPEGDIIAEMRLRSQRFVQVVFAAFTLGFTALALVAHHAPHVLALSGDEPEKIARTFLCLAAGYAVCLLVWERIYVVRN
ncbi:MAG: hypothetical protein ACM3L9_08120 [Deltaproteobacteria bacterium]